MTESIFENAYQPPAYMPEEQELKPEFVIDSLEKCEWYIRKVNNICHDIETVEANAKKIVEGLENELKSLEYMYLGQFKAEVIKHIPKKKKSLKTLFGTAQFRKVKAGIEIVDKALIPTEYSQEVISYELDKEKIKTDVLDNGVVIPGVLRKDERDELYIKP